MENTTESIKESWGTFNLFFWVLFIAKVLIAYVLLQNEQIVASQLFPILLVAQILVILLMVANMGYFAYRFSGKKLYALHGLWGFLWVGVVTIFIGYLVVKHFRDKRIKAIESSVDKKEVQTPPL